MTFVSVYISVYELRKDNNVTSQLWKFYPNGTYLKFYTFLMLLRRKKIKVDVTEYTS